MKWNKEHIMYTIECVRNDTLKRAIYCNMRARCAKIFVACLFGMLGDMPHLCRLLSSTYIYILANNARWYMYVYASMCTTCIIIIYIHVGSPCEELTLRTNSIWRKFIFLDLPRYIEESPCRKIYICVILLQGTQTKTTHSTAHATFNKRHTIYMNVCILKM